MVVEAMAANHFRNSGPVIFSWRDSSSTGPIAVTEQQVAARSAISEEQKLSFENQADAPACHECGSIMIRNGSCYRCLNCGATSGCS